MSTEVLAPVRIGPDPRLFEIVPFMRYDESGRFTDDGKMGIAIIEQKQMAGELILANVIADRDTEWFDGTDILPRPVLDLPAEIEAVAGIEAIIPGLPGGTVRFAGPVSGEHEHEGGPLQIGFTIPGVYTLRCEPFPARPIKITLTVTA